MTKSLFNVNIDCIQPTVSPPPLYCDNHSLCICQAIHHSTLALEAGDDRTRAESSLILASGLKDLGQLDEAEDVRNVI